MTKFPAKKYIEQIEKKDESRYEKELTRAYFQDKMLRPES
jgi:hypothetical protein